MEALKVVFHLGHESVLISFSAYKEDAILLANLVDDFTDVTYITLEPIDNPDFELYDEIVVEYLPDKSTEAIKNLLIQSIKEI